MALGCEQSMFAFMLVTANEGGLVLKSINQLKRIAGIFLILMGMIGIASAKPIEVRSENFVFYGDTSEKSAVTLIEGLEEYREIIFTLFQTEPGPETIPVKVIGVASPEKVGEITGRENASGVYVTTLEGPLFILSSKGGFRSGKPARQIALHEYTHHLIANYTNQHYPTWFNEGFAEYLSTFDVSKKGVVSIGLPNDGRAYALTQKKWFPMDRFVGAIRNYPYNNASDRNTRNVQSLFYSQSWLAVHYIQSTSGMSDKFKAYLKLINSADVPEDAFEQGFGMTPDEFGDRLRAYFKANRFLTSRITLKESYIPKKAKVREISKAELQFHQADASRFFSGSKEPSEYVTKLLAKAQADPQLSGDVALTQAFYAFKNDKLSEALSLAQTAVQKAPDDPRANVAVGAVSLELYERLGGSEHLTRARKVLKHAMRQDPDYVYAHYLYAKSYFITKSRSPSKQAVASAESALLYYRAKRFMGESLEMATVLMHTDNYRSALPTFIQVQKWGRYPRMRRFAERQIKEIEARESRNASSP